MEKKKEFLVRESLADGFLYPDNSTTLKKRIRTIFEQTTEVKNIPAKGFYSVVLPHSNIEYTGHLCAAALSPFKEHKINRVIIAGPVHREEEDLLFLPESEIFNTPLGPISIDTTMLRELMSCSTKFVFNESSHLEEHCIEVLLPFILHLFPEATLVPILMGAGSVSNIEALSKSLYLTFAPFFEECLFIFSANLSSFEPKKEAELHAASLIEDLASKNTTKLEQHLSSNRYSSRGAACIASGLALFQGNGFYQLVETASSPVTDEGNCVEYGSFIMEELE